MHTLTLHSLKCPVHFHSLLKVGYDMTRLASQKAFERAGVSPRDVQVVELHDCFSANELISYEALGLCGEGQQLHTCVCTRSIVVALSPASPARTCNYCV